MCDGMAYETQYEKVSTMAIWVWLFGICLSASSLYSYGVRVCVNYTANTHTHTFNVFSLLQVEIVVEE